MFCFSPSSCVNVFCGICSLPLSVSRSGIHVAFFRLLLLCNSLEDGIDESFWSGRCRRCSIRAEKRIVPDGTREKAQDLSCVKILSDFSLRLRPLNYPGSLLKARREYLIIICLKDFRMSRHQPGQLK